MEFKFQLRRKDKRCLIPVSRDVHSALCFYATKTDTTITDAVNRIFFWFFEQEFKIQITPEHPLEKNKPPVFKKADNPQ